MPLKPYTLLFFVRWPEPGRVKTRLAETMGAEEACRIHTLLAERSFAAATSLAKTRVIVCGTGWRPSAFERWLPGADDYWDQPEGGLGERLELLFTKAFEEDTAGVLAIGSDAPLLRGEDIGLAAIGLRNHDVSILPANDGGYVLIGSSAFRPYLFRDMPWSRDNLFGETLSKCRSYDLSVYIGPTFGDVDREDDWNCVSSLVESRAMNSTLKESSYEQ